ncbi:ribonuclease-III-like-domain-containing protein [Calycina marina]|uniref:Ribonuclease-III-like-domain-containing protein n=1 Tax=Calycina marina TaxID=1763456 RepID=A0A9P7YZ99_9HELO|nr:ribonuclease-III-like-domain-containing protein [Calycina marina]
MASKATYRTGQLLIRRSRPSCQCLNSPLILTSSRQISTSSPRSVPEYETEKKERPRWSYTPEGMKAPYPVKIKDPAQAWECNSDPIKLDQFYIRFLGPGGDKVLTDETKWLAITHKSFDQGRRGFNDRLAFLGRRIITLQTTLALLNSSVATKTQTISSIEDGRVPIEHPALQGLNNLTSAPIDEVLTKYRLGGLATQAGMRDIMRWKPRLTQNLERSGIDVALTTSLYAVIGAIDLERGMDVANQVTREKILKPLGIS